MPQKDAYCEWICNKNILTIKKCEKFWWRDKKWIYSTIRVKRRVWIWISCQRLTKYVVHTFKNPYFVRLRLKFSCELDASMQLLIEVSKLIWSQSESFKKWSYPQNLVKSLTRWIRWVIVQDRKREAFVTFSIDGFKDENGAIIFMILNS